MTGVWSGAEAKNFNAVLAGFKKQFPGVSVKYTSAGDNTPTVLSTAVQGGNPPDLAAIAQPGLVKDFATRGALKPINFVKPTMAKYYAPSWITLGTVKGKLYGMVFKGANKSTIWYNVARLQERRCEAAEDVDRPDQGCGHAAGVGHEGVLDRRGGRLDADRPAGEHLPAPGRRGEVRPALDAHDQVDRPVGDRVAEDDGADLQRDVEHLSAARRVRCRPTSRPR